MGCFCGGATATQNQELPIKSGAGPPREEEDVLSYKAGGTDYPGQDGQEELRIKARVLQVAERPCSAEGEGWDAAAPCRANEAGSAQIECWAATAAAVASDVQPALQSCLEDGLGLEDGAGLNEADPAGSRSPTDEQQLLPVTSAALEEQGQEEAHLVAAEEELQDEEKLAAAEEEAPEFPPAPREALQPLADPEEGLLASLACLDAADSEEDLSAIIRALTILRRLAIHHSHLLLPYLGGLVELMAGYVQAADDAVCVTAMMVVVDMLISLGDAVCRHMDDGGPAQEGGLLQALLQTSVSVPRPATAGPGRRPGTAATRRAQEEWRASPAGMADLALRVMVDYCSQHRVIALLQAFTHFQQPCRIRSAASALVVMATYNKI